jgi:hypothetical protein
VVGATRILEYTRDLPRFPSDHVLPADRVLDIFDFLYYAFGFQVKFYYLKLYMCNLDSAQKLQPLYGLCASMVPGGDSLI